MVGRAIQERIWEEEGVFVGSRNFDLTNSEQVKDMFKWNSPTHVIHLAAKVGGVKANMEANGDFCALNQQINANVLRTAHETKSCVKVVSLLSTCVYPDSAHVSYPLTESQLHKGPPHSSNFGYAYSKRMIEVQSRAYNEQCGNKKFICAIPNNLYGKYDNFDLQDSHVVPAMMRKIYEAKENNAQVLKLWGTGEAIREFTYVSDVARDLLNLTNLVYPLYETYNIGNTLQPISIKRLAKTLCIISGFDYDKIEWDVSEPTGQLRKPSSVALYNNEYPMEYYTTMEDGLKETWDWFVKNYPNVRGASK